ncbi:MAG TPA: GWxTD domain-containing protein [Gemmatimonadaceae bacterium]|nr:GWxTD domain-containing protein [Gemmatimonadaceae bacterium]
MARVILCAALAVQLGCINRPIAFVAGPRVSRADSLLAAGDTAAALALLDSVVQSERQNAAAWHRRGMVAWAKGRPARRLVAPMSQENIDLLRAADTSLRLARRLAPDSGRYALDLGRYFLYADLITLRLQAPGHFRHALEVARKVNDRSVVAEALDEVGMVYWRRYELLADRRLLPGLPFVDLEELVSNERNIRVLVTEQSVTPKPPLGTRDYERALSAFQDAVSWDPTLVRAHRHLGMALVEKEEWQKLAEHARQVLGSRPDDALGWSTLGLARHRMGDAIGASTAFDSALLVLSPSQRRRVADISRILTRKDSLDVVKLGESARHRFERVFWLTADPLAITNANALRNEFLARVIHADLRWTSDDFDLWGADSDRGQIWVRYGPPGIMASFAAPESQSEHCRPSDLPLIQPRGGDPARPLPADFELVCSKGYDTGTPILIWYYPELNLHFAFRTPPTYGTATHAGAYAAVAADARQAAPAAWTSVPGGAYEIDSLPVSVVRFLAPGDSIDALVATQVDFQWLTKGSPVDSTVEVALLAFDYDGRTVLDERSRESVPSVDRTPVRQWSVRLGRGTTLYRVEALGTAPKRGARALGHVSSLSGLGFRTSDLLLAEQIHPRGPVQRRWTDFEIAQNAGIVRSGNSLGLLWETYSLTSERGLNRYRVRISLAPEADASGIRRLAARIVGGLKELIGQVAQGSERVELEYTRELSARDVQVDYLSIALEGVPQGRYRIEVTIHDLYSNRAAKMAQSIAVTAP